MSQFDLKKFLTENKLTSNTRIINETNNREVQQALDGIGDAITKLRKLGNEAYGGEKKNIYATPAGKAFQALDKAYSNLANELHSMDPQQR
mgnify:CR=1 FL=1|jgi:hypothetical protein